MEKNTSWYRPELWGGMECTINRVGENFQDQLEYAGYYQRENDLEEFARLGIRSFRFPILWEKHQPERDTQIDWSFAQRNLDKLRSLNIVPIAGLLHHGSGPAFTHLADEIFPELFANYAEQVAARFPFLEYFTPVNEPLTTARFSGLYGLWYPHKKNDASFARMIVNQAKATVLAMTAIRKINPDAKLVQTEDLGKVLSTDKLQYQANFENARRWLTYDLLCGKLSEKHRMWKYLVRYGIKAHELKFFQDNKCPPDIIGCNYYITSERYLDHETQYYPRSVIGGNKKHRYADVEAIRVQHNKPWGLKTLVREVWERYQLPIAITEVQLHCHRDDQMRWFQQSWNNVVELKNEGIDIRAITAWALLGAFGWNKLLTGAKGDYETGVFDIRSGTPRPTGLYSLIRSLNDVKKKDIPFIQNPGWWERENRFIKRSSNLFSEISYSDRNGSAPILIFGKRGTLGRAFAQLCETRALNYRLLGREDADITNAQQVEALIDRYKPWAIVNAAGFVRVDDAEKECEQCFLSNTKGPATLAAVCRKHGIRFVTFSSDLVFDGKKSSPYVETDSVSPLNVYGKSKAECESSVLKAFPESLVIRTSAFFGPWDRYNFVTQVVDTLERNETFHAIDELRVSPTYVPDLVNYSLDLMLDEEVNIWHLANKGEASWFELARNVAERAGKRTQLIAPQPFTSLQLPAVRPVYSVLKSEKGIELPTLDHALDRYFAERNLKSARSERNQIEARHNSAA